MNILSYTFEEYVALVRAFHGYPAPGVVIGGFMVDLAYQNLPPKGLFDAICETDKCLPDAIQLLTPCTIGNGWLRVTNMGRFALTLYDKHNGEGIRVFLDPLKLGAWPEINSWFFRQKPKEEQDSQLLMEQIGKAGANICNYKQVKIGLSLLKKQPKAIAICPHCKEAYPIADGEMCSGCQGKFPCDYENPDKVSSENGSS